MEPSQEEITEPLEEPELFKEPQKDQEEHVGQLKGSLAGQEQPYLEPFESEESSDASYFDETRQGDSKQSPLDLFQSQLQRLQEMGSSQPTISASSGGFGFPLTFAYGLILGQLSVILVMIFFIRFFIFADPPASKKDYQSHMRQQRQTRVLPSNAASTSSILEKTYYNVSTHKSESLDWFTVLIAQALTHVRNDARSNNNLLKTLDTILNGDKIPDFIDKIKINELNIGDDFPIFSNCKIISEPVHDGGENSLEAQMDVDLTDIITLGIETRVLLNFPKPLFAFLPISVSVSLVRFSGRLTVSMVATKEDGDLEGKTYLAFSFAPDYNLEFSVKSLIGSRARLQDVPKVGQIVESRLRKWFVDRCVEPRYQQIPLPPFWPRSKTTKVIRSMSVNNKPSSEEVIVEGDVNGHGNMKKRRAVSMEAVE